MKKRFSDEKLIEMFESDCKLRGLAVETTRRYIDNIKLYMDFLHARQKGFLDVDKQILKEFIGHLRNERQNKVKTLENVFSSLNAFYDLLVFEEINDSNIVGPVRKRFLNNYKDEQVERQVPEVETMARFINSIPKVRDKAINLLFAKTGIRRNELITLDVGDINWEEQSITLKRTKKRSNLIVFFDAECARILRRWLQLRETLQPQTHALFIGESGRRLHRAGVYDATIKWATTFGLHNPKADNLQDRFSPHGYRHWFTTILRRNGMRREFIQELRGDVKTAAIDIYDHIDKKELRQAYLVAMPELGII